MGQRNEAEVGGDTGDLTLSEMGIFQQLPLIASRLGASLFTAFRPPTRVSPKNLRSFTSQKPSGEEIYEAISSDR
jgi:hypothetical protein